MPDVDTLDAASLEQFETELIRRGFEPDPNEPGSWIGPIADTLGELTTASTMRIRMRAGWPFYQPQLIVDGIDSWHCGADGEVCLWHPGAHPEQWIDANDYFTRIDEWADHAKNGFDEEDFALDAHRSFAQQRVGVIATIEVDTVLDKREVGARGRLSAKWSNSRKTALEIVKGEQEQIAGRWYVVPTFATPPRTLDDVRAALNGAQRNNFDRRYRAVERGKPMLFVVSWEREHGQECLVLLAENKDGEVHAESLEVAPTDEHVLALRAGPDFALLQGKRIAVFGAGAIGSQVAVLLARAGAGSLVISDGEALRPGNVVRHASSSLSIGDNKAHATRFTAYCYAPWTRVQLFEYSSWLPKTFRQVIAQADLVIDATGVTGFTSMASMLCTEAGKSLVSVALYRGGAVGRVRRHAHPDDMPIHERGEAPGRLHIPFGEEPAATFEPGCSAPVNNASPVSVAAIATTAAQVAVDALAGRWNYADEVIDVYEPLAEAPFDRVGRVEC